MFGFEFGTAYLRSAIHLLHSLIDCPAKLRLALLLQFSEVRSQLKPLVSGKSFRLLF